jgi:hypothetical protein
MVAHVEGFGFFHADSGVKDTVSSGVVGLQGSASRRLFVTHFFKGGDHGDGLLGVEKKATGFGFGGRGGDSSNRFAKDVYGTVGLGIRRGGDGTWEAGQEKMTRCTAASVWKHKIGGIGADGENHVAGVITDRGIRMCGEVVQEHVASLLGVLCRGGLAVGDFIEGDDDSGVTATGVVEEQSRDLLNPFDAKFVEERRKVGVGKLDFLTVDRGCPAMGRVLRSGRWNVTQRVEGLGDVAGHGDVYMAGLVVPINLESEVVGSSPVDG